MCTKQILHEWLQFTNTNRGKRNERILIKICAIDSIYRSGLRQLHLYGVHENLIRKRKSFIRWKSLFNQTMNERVLYHRIRLCRRNLIFSFWKSIISKLEYQRKEKYFKNWLQLLRIREMCFLATDHHSALLIVKALYCWEMILARKRHAKILIQKRQFRTRNNFFDSWIRAVEIRIKRRLILISTQFRCRLNDRTKLNIFSHILKYAIGRRRIEIDVKSCFIKRIVVMMFNQWKEYAKNKTLRRKLMMKVQRTANESLANSKMARIFNTMIMLHLAQIWRRKALQTRCLDHLIMYCEEKQEKKRLIIYADMYSKNLILKRYFKWIKKALRVIAHRDTSVALDNMQNELLLKNRAMISWSESVQRSKIQGGN